MGFLEMILIHGRLRFRFASRFILALCGFVGVGLTNNAHANTPVFQLPSCQSQWSHQNILQSGSHHFRRTHGQFAGGLGLSERIQGDQESYDNYSKPLERQKCKKDWTVLVYMAANNDLLPYAFWDLYEMEAGFKTQREFLAGSGVDLDVLVQLDQQGSKVGSRSSRVHIFESEAVFDNSLGLDTFQKRSLTDLYSPLISSVDNSVDSEGAKFESFVDWGLSQYPSENLMIVVWGHGQGWKLLNPPPSSSVTVPLSPEMFSVNKQVKEAGALALNSATGSYLRLDDINLIFRRQSAKHREGRPVDVLISDSCLMQMIEVVAELNKGGAASARFAVGSAQVETLRGLPYRRIFYEMNKGGFNGESARANQRGQPRDEPYWVAKMVPPLMKASLGAGSGGQRASSGGANDSMMLSSLSLVSVEHELIPAFNRFAKTLKEYLIQDSARKVDLLIATAQIPKLISGGVDLSAFRYCVEKILDAEYLELKSQLEQKTISSAEFARRLEVMKRLKQSCISLEKVFALSNVALALGDDYTKSINELREMSFKGLAVWFPENWFKFVASQGAYRQTYLNKVAGDWLEMLLVLHGGETP